MRPMGSWVAVGLSLALLAGAGTATAKTTKTVKVDCAKGQRISAALEDKADELIIEISGMCQEHVVIRRDNVTLLGSDPAVDGIQGPIGDPPPHALVELYGTNDVRLENLMITGSEGVGFGAWEAGTVRPGYQILVNCRIEGNDTGAHFSVHSFGSVSRTSFSNNAGLGVRVQRRAVIPCGDCTIVGNRHGVSVARGGQFNCTRCTIEDNARWAVISGTEDGYVSMLDSNVSGDLGILAVMDSFVVGINTSVAAGNVALWATEQSDVNWYVGNLSGDIDVEWKSFLYLENTFQTATGPGGNRVEDSSTLTLQDSTLVGQTTIDTFSNGWVRGSGSSLGQLICTTGGDFACYGLVPTGGTSGCGHCP